MTRLRHMRRWILNLLLAGTGAVLAVLLFHLGVMPFFVRHAQETDVPDVRGLPAGEVATLLIGADLMPGEIGEAVDNHIPAGRILRQNPPAGARVKKGRSVHLVVSRGPLALHIPQLEGESLVHARFLLAQRGIRTGRVTQVRVSGRPADQVVASMPPSGALLAGRPAVDLLVSEAPPRKRFLMPDLRGQDAAQVQRELEEVGLVVQRRIRPGARGRLTQIVEQTPPAGYPIAAGATVEIHVGG